jgi:hypothetical protein
MVFIHTFGNQRLSWIKKDKVKGCRVRMLMLKTRPRFA